MLRSIFADETFLRDAVKKSECFADVIRFAKCKTPNINGRSGHYTTLKKWLATYNICTDHFKNTMSARGLKARFESGKAKKLEDHLVVNSTIQTERLKRRLWRAGLLPEQCKLCGQLPVWHGQHLVLHLDHINGINNDNRLENLRTLCLHCHSQTSTYAGRNCSHRKPKTVKEKTPIVRTTKISWPDAKALQDYVDKYPIRQIAHRLGVSDNAVHKRLKKLGIEKKPLGFWNKPPFNVFTDD